MALRGLACVTWVLLLGGGSAAAQPVPTVTVSPSAAVERGDGAGASPRQMTLGDALDYARQHQPTLQAARARVDVARRAISVAQAEWLPQLGATAQIFGGTMNNTTAMFVGVRTVDLPRIGATPVNASAGLSAVYPSTLVALGLRQMVFDFGRIAAQTAVAEWDVRIASEQARNGQLEVQLQVELGYFALLAAKEVARAASDAYARALQRRDMVQVSVARGLRPPIDLTRAEADVTRFAVGRTRAMGGIEVAQALFAGAVGVPEALLDAAVPAGSEGEVDVVLPALGDAMQHALDHSPTMRAALSALLRQQAQTRAITMGWVPTLQLSASIDGRAGGAPGSSGPSGASGWIPEVPNWDVGLVLTVPLFDGNIWARRGQSRAAEQVLHHELSGARLQLLGAIQRAFTLFQVAQAAQPALVAAATAARRNYDQASARFRAGLGTSIELADAEALRTDAELQLAIGRFDVARARAAFNRAIAQGL